MPTPLSAALPGSFVAEDNPLNQRVISRLRSLLGHHGEVVENGSLALKRLREDVFDLVLMDCQMPVMDGYEAARAIRALEGQGAQVPIVALTASAIAQDRTECLAAGMTDYLTKPISLEALRSALARNLPPIPSAEERLPEAALTSVTSVQAHQESIT